MHPFQGTVSIYVNYRSQSDSLIVGRMVLRKPAAAVEPEQPDRKLVAAVPKRAPHRGVPVPPTDVKKTTAFEPFSFEGKDQ